ncbi:crotonase/enoyl-CoA hydratase family protein [Mycolicibacterium litorale]|uniref:crotonase/enoyl-CoA hydratase family protein n=1 Tax=Mycolicibacterium litorale TaxID=758802 RepID=UPI003CE7EE35
MTDSVRIERHGAVLIVTINRPQARNAIDIAVSRGIAASLAELDQDPALRVGILCGEGGWFSAGMDLKKFAAGEVPHIDGRGFGGLTEAPPAKPLIAAVEGGALAGGFEMVLACDLVVAARDGRFGLPEVKRGLTAAGGGLIRLPQRIPRNVAMELALRGGFLTAERAYDLGLVNELVEPGTSLAHARAMAESIAANGPLAVRETKRIITSSSDWPSEFAFDIQRPITDHVTASEDAREGAAAFVEKREPKWVGR